MHEIEPFMLDKASSSYNDWTGTAAAEDSMIKTSLDLHELAGLDHSKWSILGIDISAYSHGALPQWRVHVYAIDCEKHDIGGFDDLEALSTGDGAPVVDILLHDVDIEQIVRCMKGVHFQLRSPHHPNLKVVARGDHPPQD